MNAKLGWETAVAATERLAVENACLLAEIERLQRYVVERDHYRRQWSEGQNEIARLQVENQRLRAALPEGTPVMDAENG